MYHSIKPSVIGLGYVGLPVFVRLKKKYKTIGYDKNTLRINLADPASGYAYIKK